MDRLPVDRRQLADLWAEVVATARRTVADGLVVGTSGNVSARIGDLVLITPSGVHYDRLGPGDLVAVDLDGNRRLGTLRPSSEVPMHLAVYRATAARAIVHTHAVHATAVSTLVDEVPARGEGVRDDLTDLPRRPVARRHDDQDPHLPSPDARALGCLRARKHVPAIVQRRRASPVGRRSRDNARARLGRKS